MEEKTHYSESELKEFKELLLSKREVAEKSYNLYNGIFTGNSENSDEGVNPTFKRLEDSLDVTSKEEAGRLALRQADFIKKIDAALVRISNGTYGICIKTGDLIPKERLIASPVATACINVKLLAR